jgi:porin
VAEGVSILRTMLLVALVGIASSRPVKAESAATGIPNPSIATSLPSNGDPSGARAALAALGVTYGLNYVGELFDVTSGGLSRGTASDGRLEGVTDIDLEIFAGWKGAKFHTNLWYIHGVGPNFKRVGALNSISNLEALETVRFGELWIEQALLGEKLKVRFGELTADGVFYLAEAAAPFFNGGFGWPVIAAANMVQGGPGYPFSTSGVSVQYEASKDFTFLGAIYNGSPADPNAPDPQRDNRHGLNFRFGDPPLVMVEGHFKTGFALPGVVKAGGWYEFGDFSDKRTGALIEGNYALHALFDQQIWKGGEGHGISIFGRVMGAPADRNLVDFYTDAGIVFSGFVERRPHDSFGAAFGYTYISERVREADRDAGGAIVHNYEALFEINYKAEIIPGFIVSPDFQYSWNPGGHVEDPVRPGSAVRDAAVIGIRTTINY